MVSQSSIPSSPKSRRAGKRRASLNNADRRPMPTGQTDRQRLRYDKTYGDGGAAIQGSNSPKPDPSGVDESIPSATATQGQRMTGTPAAARIDEPASCAMGSSNMTADQLHQGSMAPETPSASANDIGGQTSSLGSGYTHSAPPTVTTFGAPQSSPHYSSSHHGLPHDYAAYSHGQPQSYHQQSTANFSQHMSPPPLYGPGEGYGSSENRLGHSFSSASGASPTSLSGPQHYYHSSVPSSLDDLRHSHHGPTSSAGYTRGTAGHQPYYVPSQPQRSPVYTASIGMGAGAQHFGGSSIITANPDSLPDLRYADGMSAAAAAAAASGIYPPVNFGRLPNGKIIELYPAMMRTIQACEYCRSRKAKCSGGLPCDRCKKKNMKCEYAQLDKKRKVKTTTSEVDMSTGVSSSLRGVASPNKIGVTNQGVAIGASENNGSSSAVDTSVKGTTAAGIRTEYITFHSDAQAGAQVVEEYSASQPTLRKSSSAVHIGPGREIVPMTASPFAEDDVGAVHSSAPYAPLTVLTEPMGGSMGLDINVDSDGSESASIGRLRLSPAISDDSLVMTPAQAAVMPNAFWVDATLEIPESSSSAASAERSPYYDETLLPGDWQLQYS